MVPFLGNTENPNITKSEHQISDHPSQKKKCRRCGQIHNLSKEERKALKQLSENMEIVIRQADKGGGIAIQNYKDYNAEAMKTLSDRNYYYKIGKDPFSPLEKNFQLLIKTACDHPS